MWEQTGYQWECDMLDAFKKRGAGGKLAKEQVAELQ